MRFDQDPELLLLLSEDDVWFKYPRKSFEVQYFDKQLVDMLNTCMVLEFRSSALYRKRCEDVVLYIATREQWYVWYEYGMTKFD